MNNKRLEKIVGELEIKKFLIVDDMPENLGAAQNCLKDLKGVEIDYAKNAEEAIGKIKEAYPNNSYDFIISDLEMETERSGIDVVKEGYKHQSQVFVATSYDSESHGSSTHIHPFLESTQGKKNETEVWDTILTNVIDYLHSEKGKAIYDSFKQSKKYVGKPMDNIGETLGKMLEQMIFNI